MNDSTTIAPDLRRAFAPTGTLRACINVGNPVLASQDTAGGAPRGVSIDLARALAARLGVEVEPVVFETAGKSVQHLGDDKADIGFFAIDPLRGESIAFTDAYVLIEGVYAVPAASPITCNDEVDAPGVRVAVGRGSAYDLHLTRALQHATILRADSSPDVFSFFLREGLDVAAGVKQQLQAGMAGHAGMRLLPGRFMEIRQAMGLPRSRGAEAAAFLAAFVEEMKHGGFVEQALKRHGVAGAAVAPAAGAAA